MARLTVQEERCSPLEAAAGVEQDLFAGDFDVHAEVLVGAEIFDDHVGEVMGIDDDFVNAEGAQAGERDLEQCAAGDLNQRLGTIVGERAQTRAQAGGQNHRLH